MSLIGQPDESLVVDAWLKSMHDVLNVASQAQIPELNEFQCGTYKMHSLDEAKAIAEQIIQSGIGICHNQEIALSDAQLASINQ